MTKPGVPGGSTSRNCPECGVELKAGLKYCDFCGMKVALPSSAKKPGAAGAHGTAVGVLKGIAIVCLAGGILFYVGNRLKGRDLPPAPVPGVADDKHRAAAACEAAIRQQARGPLRVIAFRSALVAEEQGGGYAVSGTVELQSAAGEVQLKRYSCRVHQDARAVMVLDEGKLH